MFEDDLGIGGDVLGGKFRKDVVVVNNAILENLDKRSAVVFVSPFKHLGKVGLHGVDGTGHEPSAGAERQGCSRNRIFNGTPGCRRGPRPGPGCRRILAFRQPVNLIVEQQDLHIHISPKDMQKMVAADG